ncbi:MAG: hypothetical protein H6R27_1452 [Proteobacteria bacterium]|nr:hypothetical protein [Pseudomonadota bacterium]
MTDTVPAWMRAAFGLSGRLSPALAARVAAELMIRPRGRNPPQAWELGPSPLLPRDIRLPGGLHALAWGDAGPVVLAQHGWRGRPTQFRRFAEALVPAGFRVVATDAPGHGLSPGVHATPRLLADTLIAAADSLGDVHGIIGHSLGGAAAALALEFGLPARRLVMIGSPSRPSRMIAAFAEQVGLPPAARAAFDLWFEAHAGRAVETLDPMALRLGPGVAAMVVHDRDDDIIPVAEAELLETAWPGARFLYTTGLGHRDLLADASVVAPVAEFMAAGR